MTLDDFPSFHFLLAAPSDSENDGTDREEEGWNLRKIMSHEYFF